MSQKNKIIEHEEACAWDRVIWGECWHGADGERIPPEKLEPIDLNDPGFSQGQSAGSR